MLATKHLRMTRGQTLTETFTVLDDSGASVDLTGATAYFALTADLKVAPLLELDSAARGGVVLSNQTTNKGQFVVTVQPTATANLVAAGDDDPYFYDAWIVDASGNRTPVVATSKLGLYAQVATIP